MNKKIIFFSAILTQFIGQTSLLVALSAPKKSYEGWIFLIERGNHYFKNRVPKGKKPAYEAHLKSCGIDQTTAIRIKDIANEQDFEKLLLSPEKIPVIETILASAVATIAWRVEHDEMLASLPSWQIFQWGKDTLFKKIYPDGFAMYQHFNLAQTKGQGLYEEFTNQEEKAKKNISFTTEALIKHFSKECAERNLTGNDFSLPEETKEIYS